MFWARDLVGLLCGGCGRWRWRRQHRSLRWSVSGRGLLGRNEGTSQSCVGGIKLAIAKTTRHERSQLTLWGVSRVQSSRRSAVRQMDRALRSRQLLQLPKGTWLEPGYRPSGTYAAHTLPGNFVVYLNTANLQCLIHFDSYPGILQVIHVVEEDIL